MKKIIVCMTILMLISCLIPATSGEIQRTDYGQFQHPSAMNWTIPKSYVDPNVTTEFDSGAVDNLTDGTSGWDASFPNSPIDGTKALYLEWKTGATSNYFRTFSVLTRAYSMQIYSTKNYTTDYTPYLKVSFYNDADNGISFTYRFYNPYTTVDIELEVGGSTESKQIMVALTNRTGSNTTLTLFASYDELTATTLVGVGHTLVENVWVGMERESIDELAQFNFRNYVNGNPSYYIDNVYQYNQSFTKTEIQELLPIDPVVVFPPLNKDFVYSEIIHADGQTYNQSVGYFQGLNNFSLKSTFTMWTIPSANISSEPLNYTNWTNLLKQQNALGHEIASHSWSDTINLLTAEIGDNITRFEDVLGFPVLGTVDHGPRQHNIEYDGGDSGSIYYATSQYDDLTWWWVNWDSDSGTNEDPAPDYTESVLEISQSWGLLHNITMDVGLTDDRFIQSSVSGYNNPLYLWQNNSILETLAATRGVVLPHTYLHRHVVFYNESDGETYFYSSLWDTHYPELGYIEFTLDKANDTYGHWELAEPTRNFYQNMTRDYDIYSAPVKDLLKRSRFIRNVTTSFYGSFMHINVSGTDSENDVTVSCASDMTNKSLYDGSSYYAFTPAAEGWGATITTLGPGNNQYTVVDTPLDLTTSLKIGKFEYDVDDGVIRLNVNKGNGVVNLEVPGDWDITDLRVYDRTLGTFVDWDEGSVEFDGVAGHLYFIYVDSTGTPIASGFNAITAVLISSIALVMVVVILNTYLITPISRTVRRIH